MTRARSQGPSHRHNHRDIPGPANNWRVSNQDDDTYVQDWLNNLHGTNNNVAGETPALGHERARYEDDPPDFESGWCPNNLPIAPLVIHRQSKQRKKRYNFLDDDTLLTSPTGSLAEGSSSPQPDHRCEVESLTDNYIADRYSLSTFARESTSREYIFEKQPRKRTRPDKYQTAGQKARAKQTNPEYKTKQNKSQPSITKRKLRSRRDILNNFTSSAFSDKRLTMPPDLTVGLFLNGRSSRMSKKVADLTFNDMSFLRAKDDTPDHRKIQAVVNKMHDDSRDDSTQERDPILCLPNFQRQLARSDEVSRPIVAIPSPTLVAKKALCRSSDKSEENGSSRAIPECQLEAPDHQENMSTTYTRDELTSRESREDRHNPQTQTRLIHDSPSTRISDAHVSILQALADTRVYDGTGISLDVLRAKHTDPEPRDRHTRESSKTQSSNTAPPSCVSTYEDKNAMATPYSHYVGDIEGLRAQKAQQDYNQDSSATIDPKDTLMWQHNSPVPRIDPIDLLYRGIGFDLKAADDTFSREFLKHSENHHELQNHEHRVGFLRTQNNTNSSRCQAVEKNWPIEHPRVHELRLEALEIGQFHAQRSPDPENHGAEELECHNENGSIYPAHPKSPFSNYSPREYIESHSPMDTISGFKNILERDRRREFLREVGPEVPYYKTEPPPQNCDSESIRDFITRIEAEVLSRDYDEDFLQANINMNEVCEYEDGCHVERDNEEPEMASFWRPNWFM